MIRLALPVLFFLSCTTGVFGQDEVDTTNYEEPVFDTYQPETDGTSEEEAYESEDDDAYDNDEESVTHITLEPDDLNSTRQYQSKHLEVKKIDKEAWKKVVGDKNYEEEKPEAEDEEEEESEAGERNTSVAPWGGAAFKMISYLLILGLAIFILYLVARNVSFSRKFKKETVITDEAEGVVDDIQNLNTQSLLQQALAQGNYRLAVRLYYLELLKKLNENGVIIWKKDKTNRDYLSEIFQRDYYYDDVRKLTLAYELVWYGERSLTLESFQRLISNFENLHEKFTARNP